MRCIYPSLYTAVYTFVVKSYTAPEVHNSESTEGLRVTAAVTSENWRMFPWNYQRSITIKFTVP